VLGDGGSNLLGFTAGLGLVLVLPGWGVWVAAGVAVVLNVLADTVTLSRMNEAAPPLRWYDALGRVAPGD
jgi:UDP-N-acetylmuramyl pentapeptide phosphotransferase/UDP-N-acetylglucosamine-1-phosphate transferase